ncbi:DUF1772 domain-containing protein [Hymenobacter edaphi]|uniref:DUF1772 domain-containing protein n=1 Tax=Hymenobacter edaphi TaxID=2211146 RepID=A0A328BGX7_9BACT|nr:DUF1772 domain-containing protein [Hymenobacter edaphi]RAK65186.1 hypothetical protein DLM85_16750 [Hymenobacter edaphi]
MKTTPAPSLRRRLGYTLFSLAFISCGAVLGGSLYQLIAEVPNWSTNPAQELQAYQQFFRVSHAGYFFQALMPLTILSLGAATALLWNQGAAVRRLLLLVLAGLVLNEVFTLVYFMPRNLVLFVPSPNGVDAETVTTMAREWQMANYPRLAITVGIILGFLRTHRLLSAPTQPATETPAKTWSAAELRPELSH